MSKSRRAPIGPRSMPPEVPKLSLPQVDQRALDQVANKAPPGEKHDQVVKEAKGDDAGKGKRQQVRDTPRRRADLETTGAPPPERTTVHLDAHVAQRLRAECGARRWSLSYAVQQAVEQYLDQLDGTDRNG
jgi:hypothetical protein